MDLTRRMMSAFSAGGGGGTAAGSTFKILNKLDGQLIGGPTYDDLYSHQYEFSGEVQSSIILPLSESFPFTDDISTFTAFHCNYGAMHFRIDYNSPFNDIYGMFYIHVYKDGTIAITPADSITPTQSQQPMKMMYIASDIEGNFDVDYFYVQYARGLPCFLKDTSITLSDYSTKPVQDITYNDELLVWNFDEGRYDSTQPLWIKKTQTSSYYYKVTLDNGLILNLVGSDGKCHRLFSLEDGMFISATDMVGKTTYTLDGESKVISCEIIEETVEFYNIITDYHINLFANGVLTSCRYNNIYPIKDMKFVKDNRVISDCIDNEIYKKYYNGLRLGEQNISIEDTMKYLERLELLRK